MPRPLVIYVGDRSAPEFAAPLDWLHERVALMTAENMKSAGKLVESSPTPPAMIVVGQSRVGEHTSAAFERLRALAPLTPIVSLLGSWCEGLARTGKPWPGAVRVYAHQFVPRASAQLAQFARSGTMSWSPPFTASDEDRLLASAPWPRAGARKRIAVVAKQQSTARALCDALAAAGYNSRQVRELKSDELQACDLAIWDCPAGFAASRSAAVELTQRLHGIPWIALVSFPRSEDQTDIAALGAAAVISKPFVVEDLLTEVRACLPIG